MVAHRSKSRSASPVVDKTKPNFAPSGLLAAATNTVTHEGGKTTFLKYNEPPEARKPAQSWRLYVFKGQEEGRLGIP
jgi:smad nuclear-interacting protein 1